MQQSPYNRNPVGRRPVCRTPQPGAKLLVLLRQALYEAWPTAL